MAEDMNELAGMLGERLWDDGVVVVQDGPLVLKSGRVSHVYVNFRDFALCPDNLDLMCRVFGAFLAQSFPGAAPTVALGAVHSLLSPHLAGALAREFRLPVALHRPGREEKGMAETVFFAGRAPSMRGRSLPPVVLVDDVASTGATLRAAAAAFARAGLDRARAFVFVDKRTASEAGATGLEVFAPLTLARVLAQGLDQGRVAAPLRGKVKAELAYLGT